MTSLGEALLGPIVCEKDYSDHERHELLALVALVLDRVAKWVVPDNVPADWVPLMELRTLHRHGDYFTNFEEIRYMAYWIIQTGFHQKSTATEYFWWVENGVSWIDAVQVLYLDYEDDYDLFTVRGFEMIRAFCLHLLKELGPEQNEGIRECPRG